MRSAHRFPSLLPLLLVLALPVAGCDFTYDLFDDPGVPAKEDVLRTTLHTLRDVIGQYHGDKGRHPETLHALLESGYLRQLPIDPFTRSSDTWIAVYAPTAGAARSLIDVRSGAEGRGSDGRPYRDW